MAGIFIEGGSLPDDVGLPNPPSDIVQDPSCQLKGYGPGCGLPPDRNSLNQMIWALAWVAYRAGCTPKCGREEGDVSWLADAIEKLVCNSLIECDTVDPSDDVVTSETVVENDDGTTTTCITAGEPDVCPPIRYNKSNCCWWGHTDDGWKSINPKPIHMEEIAGGGACLIIGGGATWYDLSTLSNNPIPPTGGGTNFVLEFSYTNTFECPVMLETLLHAEAQINFYSDVPLLTKAIVSHHWKPTSRPFDTGTTNTTDYAKWSFLVSRSPGLVGTPNGWVKNFSTPNDGAVSLDHGHPNYSNNLVARTVLSPGQTIEYEAHTFLQMNEEMASVDPNQLVFFIHNRFDLSAVITPNVTVI